MQQILSVRPKMPLLQSALKLSLSCTLLLQVATEHLSQFLQSICLNSNRAKDIMLMHMSYNTGVQTFLPIEHILVISISSIIVIMPYKKSVYIIRSTSDIQ